MPSSPARMASSPTGISDLINWIRRSFHCFRFRTTRVTPLITQRFQPPTRRSYHICSRRAQISFVLLARRQAIQESGPVFTTKWIISPAENSVDRLPKCLFRERKTTVHSDALSYSLRVAPNYSEPSRELCTYGGSGQRLASLTTCRRVQGLAAKTYSL